MDMAVGAVLSLRQATPLVLGVIAIGAETMDHAIDATLLALEMTRLAPGQITAMPAMRDPFVLTVLATFDAFGESVAAPIIGTLFDA